MDANLAPTPEAKPITRPWLGWLLLCLGIYAVLAGLLAWQVPINAAPDELAQIRYVQYLAEEKSLPVFDDTRGANRGDYEYHQPPLYYAVCAPLWAAAPVPWRGYVCRFVTLICGAVVLVLLWAAVRELFPDDGNLAIIATAFAALWPLHQIVGASAGNDAPATVFTSLGFYLIARGWRRGWSPPVALALGAAIGLGLLTKNSCLMLLPAAVGAAWRGGNTAGGWKKQGGVAPEIVVMATTLALCGWWWLRNTELYGDPLAAKAFDRAFSQTSLRPMTYIVELNLTLFGYLRALWIFMFTSFWGLFGGPSKIVKILDPFGTGKPALEAVQAAPLILVCAIATAMPLGGLYHWRRNIGELLPAPVRAALFWWAVGAALVFWGWVQFNFIQFQGQARYIQPALLPLALGFALGWRYVLRRPWQLWLASAVLAVTLVTITLFDAFYWRTMA